MPDLKLVLSRLEDIFYEDRIGLKANEKRQPIPHPLLVQREGKWA